MNKSRAPWKTTVSTEESLFCPCAASFFFFLFFHWVHHASKFMYKWWRRAKARIILNKNIDRAYRGHFHSRKDVLSYVDKTVRKASAYCFICVHDGDKSTN